MSNPYKEGSAKAAIYQIFTDAGGGEKGLAAAHKHAAKKSVGIKPGTVKSWSSMWLKGQTKPGTRAEPKADKAPKLKNGEYEPAFKYTTRERADAEHESLCERNGLRPHAFHVLENEGRFAVVPAHYKPGGPMPTFKVGDVVYDALIPNSKARVIEAGPEQSIVRYVTDRPSRPREECVINRFLVTAPALTKGEAKEIDATPKPKAKAKPAPEPKAKPTKTRQRL